MPTIPLSSAAQQIVAKALIDSNFRDALAKNTDATLKSEAPGLSASDITAIKNLKPQEWGNLSLNDLNSRVGKAASWTVSGITSKQRKQGPNI
jgi:hypothetical protein